MGISGIRYDRVGSWKGETKAQDEQQHGEALRGETTVVYAMIKYKQ